MSQLVAYYDEKPHDLKGKVEILQAPIASAAGLRSSEGVVRCKLVYVRTPVVVSQGDNGPDLVPFGEYEEWSLRDRYNEAIRIMNRLGASTITCETYRAQKVRRGIRAKVLNYGTELTQQRVENSGFDFKHEGAGSAPRDPTPLRWPDEPGFAAAVMSVLDNGATEVVINIKSNTTYSLKGSLAGQLKGVGFDLGGAAQRSGETSLHIRATFAHRKGWF